jgi:membrane glycosyltransferase
MQTEKAVAFPESNLKKKSGGWRRIILLCLLPLYALIGWLRFHEALNYWGYLTELNVWPRPLYFAITGAVLGAGFTLGWVFLLLKLKASTIYNRLLGLVFLLWFWVDRIWLSLRAAFFNQLLVAFFITAITLGWLFLLIQKTDLPRKDKPNEPQSGTGSQILSE